MITVRELSALLNEVHDVNAPVHVKDNTVAENCSSNILAARYEKAFKQFVKDENEEVRAEYDERVVLVI